MKHFHGVNPANVDGTGEDRYTAPIWYTTQAEEMELQSMVRKVLIKMVDGEI